MGVNELLIPDIIILIILSRYDNFRKILICKNMIILFHDHSRNYRLDIALTKGLRNSSGFLYLLAQEYRREIIH